MKATKNQLLTKYSPKKCSVCSATAYYSYYGALACDPCRTFFRRQVQAKKVSTIQSHLQTNMCMCLTQLSPQIHVCNKNSTCNIPPVTGRGVTKCTSCRFQKCLSVGMKPEVVEFDISNLTKQHRRKRYLQEICHLMSKPIPSLFPISDSFDYPLLKKSPNCKLEYRIIRVNTSKTRKEIVIDVLKKDSYAQSLLNIPQIPFAINEDENALHYNTITIPSRAGNYVFTRNGMYDWDVAAFLPFASSDRDVIVMKEVSEDLWVRLQQMIPIARLLIRFATATKTYPSQSSYSDWQQVIFSVSNDAKVTQMSAIIESMLKNFMLEDQIIVLKEALLPGIFLLRMYVYSQEDHCFLLSAFGNEVYLAIQLPTMLKINERETFDVNFIQQFYPFLRQDFFVITILCVLFIFDERSGISSTDLFNRERTLFRHLLDKYITAMISSGKWSVTKELVWDNIEQLLTFLPRYCQMMKT